jgi:hypothetical protein
MGKTIIDDCNIANCPKDPRRLEDLRPQTFLCSSCVRNVYNCSSTVARSDWRRIWPYTEALPDIHPNDLVLITEGVIENFEATVEEINEEDQAAHIYLNVFGMHVPFWISMRYLRRVARTNDSQDDALG